MQSSTQIGVCLWQADQFVHPNEPGPPPLITLDNLNNLVSRYEVVIDDVRAWATISSRRVST